MFCFNTHGLCRNEITIYVYIIRVSITWNVTAFQTPNERRRKYIKIWLVLCLLWFHRVIRHTPVAYITLTLHVSFRSAKLSVPFLVSCRRIWRYWTSKMLVRYILSSVCLTLIPFSQLSFMQYIGLCIQLFHLSYDHCENTCTLSCYIIIEWGVCPICQCL